MRDGHASRTARAVALFRAIASDPAGPFRGVNDSVAQSLLGSWGFLVPLGRALPTVSRVVTLGLLTHIAQRTAYIDAVVRARAPGLAQVVILGAGLDARGYRMPELAHADVFEVDHPSTQAEKRAQLAALSPGARRVVHVPVDFERDDLHERLASSGHDAAAPTLWLWEGVTPYLRAVAIDATLAVVRQRSAPGSALVMSYATPERARPSFLPQALVPRRTVAWAFRLLGESLLTVFEPAQAAARVEHHGLQLVEDAGGPEWARRFGPSSQILIGERVLVAERR